jgi:hypothetical protein
MSQQVRQALLDPAQCFRVRDLRFTRDEIKLYFTDGYLIFGKPANGIGITAVFSNDVEGGEAELLLLPPSVRERRSLANFAKSPNLNTRFGQAIMVFTDETAAELRAMIQEAGSRSSEEMGNVLASRWNSTLSSFIGSFEVRLVEDVLSPRRKELGFFFAAIGNSPLGNFDIIFDPRQNHQVSLGQVTFREGRSYFDTWTNFQSRSFRMGQRPTPLPDLKIESYKIDATIDPELKLSAVSRIRVIPQYTDRTLALELSQQMKVTAVTVDGALGEAFSPASLRANLLRSNDNNLVLISAGREFPANQPVELEVRHEGNVIQSAGQSVYFVSARGAWYPNRMSQFASFDVTFTYPKTLDLVATGDLVSEVVEGDTKISRRTTASPARFFGFNLGDYERIRVKRGELTVEVCANKGLEAALRPPMRAVELPPMQTQWPRGQRRPTVTQPPVIVMPPPLPDPTARLQELAAEVAGTLEELSARFGKPPITTLTISPIPGRFGQGFPGLVYLSTMAYLDSAQRPIPKGNTMQQVFFDEILHAHEVAHQWWGNGVGSADYQDDWMMEALANYSAIWLLERKKGARTLQTVLEAYKNDLLRKTDDGESTIESVGPITIGQRLYSSKAPNAWSLITYHKGSWILHMLRRRMGDDRFQQMLAALYGRNKFRAITTEDFRKLAVEFLPPGSPDPKLENFFDQWVNGTGIPALKLTTSVSGKAPRVKFTATVTQSEVDEEFSTWVPIEIQVGRAKPIVKWVQTSNEPVQLQLTLPAAPTKVTLNPGEAVLIR